MRRPFLYVLGVDGEPVPTTDLEAWGVAMDDLGARQIALDCLADGSTVSTVFLGVDGGLGMGGPPLLYETLVRPAEGSRLRPDQWRMVNRHAASARHDQVVAECKARLISP